MRNIGPAAGLLLAALLFVLVPALAGQEPPPPPPPPAQSGPPEGFVLIKTITQAGNAAWTDTGLQVKVGDEVYFEAEGSICIQKNNPVATCGPEGLALRTMQQPLPDKNLGSLIGMVVFRTDVIEDKQTKEKSERRYGERFAIGSGGLASMPEEGKLMLGVNENITGDNTGEFVVRIYRKPPPGA
jgi:hypothetical protein